MAWQYFLTKILSPSDPCYLVTSEWLKMGSPYLTAQLPWNRWQHRGSGLAQEKWEGVMKGQQASAREKLTFFSTMKKIHLPWKHSWKMKHPGFWLNRFLSISSLLIYFAKLKKKVYVSSFPKENEKLAKSMTLVLEKLMISKIEILKKKGGTFSFGKQAKPSDSVPTVSSSKFQQSYNFRI